MRRRRRIAALLTYAGAAVVVIVMGFPLYGIVLTSIQEEDDIRSRDVRFVPQYVATEHYERVLSADSGVPVRRSLANSLIVSLAAAAATVSLSLPTAYGLTRFRPPGTRLINGALASVYIFPTLLFVIPIFLVWNRLGLFDTYLGLIIPYTAFMIPFVVFMLSAFVRAIPAEVEEAARLDGANQRQILLRVVLPLLRPGIFACLLLGFILAWIEFLTPLLFTSELTLLTVALGLFRSTIDIQIGQLAAAAVITALPVILVTALFQSQIRQITTAGVEQ